MMVIPAVRNEMTKLVCQRSTWIIYLGALLLSLAAAVLQHAQDQSATASYWEYSIYMSHSSIQLFTLLAALLSAQLVHLEFAGGTIRLLLIQPCSRSSVWLTKYLTALLFSLAGFMGAVLLGPLAAFILVGVDGIARPDLMIRFLAASASRLPDFPMAVSTAFTIVILTRNMGFALLFSLIVTMVTANILPLLTGAGYLTAITAWLIVYTAVTIPGLLNFKRQDF